MSDKPPRQYAAEIAALPTRADKLAALEAVPAEYVALVKAHLNNGIARRKKENPLPV